MLTLFTPDLYLRFFRELSGVDGGNPVSGKDMAALMARYGTEASPDRAS